MGISISKVISISGADELVQLQMSVENDDWLPSGFTAIEVERSRGLSTGPFEKLTAQTWGPARIPANGGNASLTSPVPTCDVVGLKLKLLLNEEDEYEIEFVANTGGDPTLTLREASEQIATFFPLRFTSWVDVNSKLVIETVEVGTGASLRVVGGDAAPKLGLPTCEPYSLAFGKSARPALVLDKERYSFLDIRGSSEYFYRVRFINDIANTASQYSQPHPAEQHPGIDSAFLVTGRARLANIDGTPMANTLVRVYAGSEVHYVDGRVIGGSALSKTTNLDGVADFLLLRGVKVNVAIDGTSIIREITVPTDPAEGVFNLFDQGIGPDDYWRVKYPDLEFAQRRSL